SNNRTPPPAPPPSSAPVASVSAPPETPPVEAAAPAPAPPEGMLLVQGGTFMMGNDGGGEGDEKPAHQVKVASFWLDKTEVTQSMYDACIAAKVCGPADSNAINAGGGTFKGPNH